MTKTNPSQKPKPPERKWVEHYSPTHYQNDLLQDFHLTTDMHKLWEKLERVLMSTQRNAAKETKPAVCEAMDYIINDLKMFADQGKLDLEFIKSQPSIPGI